MKNKFEEILKKGLRPLESMRFLTRTKNLFFVLFGLGIFKLFLALLIFGVHVYELSAKEEKLPAGCPPDFADFLQVERQRLSDKEKELRLKQEELKLLEARIQEQLTSLKELEASVEEKLNRIQAVQDERTKLLVRAISEMKPSKAADILINMDKDMAVKILSQLKSSQVASILSAMPPDKAASISESLSGKEGKE
ncbi:MAG: MgtE intracellular region [Thermodesulfobacterium sp. 37_54]|uniref:MotE family protein n=1 Tax=Thermodesulfobacterium commune TaxID=1741 RepID=UPI0007465AE5|nr:MAG: MgtE intracellular region [Thermodesulfobacterium sp. 37_54]HBT04752.1 hypothetical protein [Thermodesulfobacterium commune]HCP09994.1 hypothetical protein [Thermodesulfobacterium commune]